MDAFAYVYYIECVLKITALGRRYFTDSWCLFDFFLVVTSLLDQFASELLSQILPVPPMLLRVLRIFRIQRVLRLIKGAKGIRDLVMTIVMSFPSLINVCSLLALVIFMYAVLGVQLFSYTVRQLNVNRDRNFETLGHAFLTLFQCLTGDGWSSIMMDLMVTEGSGVCSVEQGNCGGIISVPYFISFGLIGTFVFLNLIVAVILENFSKLSETNPELVSASDIVTFTEVWSEFDPDADKKIATVKLPRLVLRLPPPMGIEGECLNAPEKAAMRLCLGLNLQQVDGEVEFEQTMKALVAFNFRTKVPDAEVDTSEVHPHTTFERSDAAREIALHILGGPMRAMMERRRTMKGMSSTSNGTPNPPNPLSNRGDEDPYSA
uniref:Sodium channel protein n=1 Tax=Haptolina ericina TaxID=156174 RepID=A0A7S3C4M4_9EUKA